MEMNNWTAKVGDKFRERSTGHVYTVDYILPAGSFGTREFDGPHVHMMLDGGKGYGVTVMGGGYYTPQKFIAE